MAFTEKPPILRGSAQEQLNALRDYLFRMAQSLGEVAVSDASVAVTETVRPDGTRVYEKRKEDANIEAVRKNAQELRDLIIKTAGELGRRIDDGDNYVIAYADSKAEAFESGYVANTDLYGSYTQYIKAEFETSARGVVESYDYQDAIDSLQEGVGLLQQYSTDIDGRIQRGIVLDPSTNQYVTGIAISQTLQFSGVCGASDPNNPGDGHVYYYLNDHQTFGLYTSSGWQFWIDGHKVGWFDANDSVLHVSIVQVEQELRMGGNWKISSDAGEFEISYVGS